MDFKISLKVEPIDVKSDDLLTIDKWKQNLEGKLVHLDATDSHEESLKVKTEAEERDWCCDPNLYVDHQVKEDIVIGPTELLKQSQGTGHHAPDFFFVCSVCNKIYKRKTNLTQHMNEEHGAPATSMQKNCKPKDKKCTKDDKIEERNSNKFSISTYAVTDDRQVASKNEIENMEKTAFNTRKLKEIVSNNSENKCRVCFKTFTLPNNLQRHINQFHIFEDNKAYSCDKCDMKFSRTDYLIRHKLVKHSEGKEILYCKCGNKFFNKWSLTRHKKGYCVLMTSKPFKLYCDYCKKSFCNKYRLTEHIKRHLNNKFKTLICDYCKKHFHRKFEIDRHMLQHLGVSLHTFGCEICNKKFTRNWSLKKHLISHSGRKPFSCKYCGRYFGSKWGCLSHEKQYCQPENNNAK